MEESDFHDQSIFMSPIPPTKGARIETLSCISDQNLQCSQRICEIGTINPYCFDDYMLAYEKSEGGGGIKEEEEVGGFRIQAASMSTITAFSLPHDVFHKLDPFAHANAVPEESDFPKVSEQEDKTCALSKRLKLENLGNKHEADEDDARGCGLSLSLSLQHPSTQRSNASSTSEISEAISSSYFKSNLINRCYGSSSNKLRVNLDLSLSLCGT